LVGTEVGILHRLRKENPTKTFIPVSANLVCADMKKVTLENFYESLRDMKTKVEIPLEISEKARRAIEAMLAVS
jgi:quinolinate synthase